MVKNVWPIHRIVVGGLRVILSHSQHWYKKPTFANIWDFTNECLNHKHRITSTDTEPQRLLDFLVYLSYPSLDFPVVKFIWTTDVYDTAEQVG